MVGAARFELVTSSTPRKRATKLRHAPNTYSLANNYIILEKYDKMHIPMENKTIKIKGARENNLKNIDLEIPKYSLNVFTGLSGSGKTTLAFDTIFNEGQRRFVESHYRT